MAQREGKCTNFGLCTMADSREAITLPDGEEFSCPECGKILAEIDGKGKSGGGSGGGGGKGKSKLALAGLAIVLLGGGLYYLLVQPNGDDDAVKKDEQKKADTQKQTDADKQAELQKQADLQKQQQLDQQKQEDQKKQQDLQTKEDQIKQEQQKLDAQKQQMKDEQARLAKLQHEKVPVPKKVDDTPKPPVADVYSGPSSGTMVWEGTVHKGELVTIDNGVANKGSIISGKLPGVAVLIQPDNTKKVAIASPPGPDNKFQRVVLRVQNNGPTKVVLSWSLP